MSDNNKSKKTKNASVVRSSVALDKDVIETLDRLAQQEQTNRTAVINQILSVVCSSPVSEAFELEKEKAELNTAQMLSRTIALYLELVESPKIETLAKKTHRDKLQMIRHLVQKAVFLYDD